MIVSVLMARASIVAIYIAIALVVLVLLGIAITLLLTASMVVDAQRWLGRLAGSPLKIGGAHD